MCWCAQAPILLHGALVNWIDSKAMFGDGTTHSENTIKQYSTYTNRFGPGAVVYWLGFIADLVSDSSDVLVTADFEPLDIIQIQRL